MFSGGKDSVAAFMALDANGPGPGRPRWLITTHEESSREVAIHGTSIDLIRQQADRLCTELVTVPLPTACDDATYRARLAERLSPLQASGLRRLAFGDLFLADIRAFREAQCLELGIEPEFPLWGRDTDELAESLPAAGVDARVCCVDAERIDPRHLGARWGRDWLDQLPAGIDPCGENGEFHTLVVDAPVFERPVDVTTGVSRITRGRFHTLEYRTT